MRCALSLITLVQRLSWEFTWRHTKECNDCMQQRGVLTVGAGKPSSSPGAKLFVSRVHCVQTIYFAGTKIFMIQQSIAGDITSGPTADKAL